MKFSAVAPMLACSILAACASPSGPLASTPGSNVVTGVTPDVVTVDFHLVNELGEQIRYGTLWYDRGRRDWYKAQEKCVDGHRTWDTAIDFHHPGPPDVAIEAMLFYKTDCREARVISDLELTNLHVKDGRALVEGRVKRTPDGGKELCVGEPHYIRALCIEIERPLAP
jgi:hypothetical protein